MLRSSPARASCGLAAVAAVTVFRPNVHNARRQVIFGFSEPFE
jgi:hypothetical protein